MKKQKKIKWGWVMGAKDLIDLAEDYFKRNGYQTKRIAMDLLKVKMP